MARSLLLRLCVVLALLLAGCSIFTTEAGDETAGWSAQRLYGEAQDQMSSSNWEKAIGYFEKIEARYPYGRYALAAELNIAYAYYKDGERASAIAAADRFIKLHPDNPHVDYAYYLKGLVNFNTADTMLTWFENADMSDRDQQATRDSFDAFKQVVTRFPNSEYAKDSALRMRYLVNALASYEVHVARWYMKRGAYIAAANRAEYCLKEYPRTPATEEAIYIMVLAYDKLGMTKLRDAADTVMHKNFPHSKYLAQGLKQSAPWWKIWDPNW
jgi:outer membrane protein assembly factor BamD